MEQGPGLPGDRRQGVTEAELIQKQIDALAALMVPCPECDGKGFVLVEHPAEATWEIEAVCGPCNGTGEVARYPGLTEDCPGVPASLTATTAEIRKAGGWQYPPAVHDSRCCDGSKRRVVQDARVAAMVLLEAWFGAPQFVGIGRWKEPAEVRIDVHQPKFATYGIGQGIPTATEAIIAAAVAEAGLACDKCVDGHFSATGRGSDGYERCPHCDGGLKRKVA